MNKTIPLKIWFTADQRCTQYRTSFLETVLGARMPRNSGNINTTHKRKEEKFLNTFSFIDTLFVY